MEAVYPEVCAADLSQVRCRFGERQIADPNRFIDIALVDADGSLDVIEIKRPSDDVLLSKTHTAIRADPGFVGTIMQAEKHLFHASKSRGAGDHPPSTVGICCPECRLHHQRWRY
jgi:hypothetical protein